MATVVKGMLLQNGAHLQAVLELDGVLTGVLLKNTLLMDRQQLCVRNADAEVSYINSHI